MIRLLVVLPLRLVALLVAVPTKLSARLLRFSLRTTWRTSRVAVRSSIVSFAVGIGVGWFLTTPTGRHLVDLVRQGVRGRLGGSVADDVLVERVRAAVAGDASTWHLPRPEIDCHGGVVRLTGSVPHEQGRRELASVVADVDGVVSVVDLLTVDDDTGGAGAVAPV